MVCVAGIRIIEQSEYFDQSECSMVPVYNSFLQEEVIYRYRIISKFSSYELHQQMKIGQPKMVFHLYSIFKIDNFPIHLRFRNIGGMKESFVCAQESKVNLQLFNLQHENDKFLGKLFVKNTLEYLELLKFGFVISRCSS